MTTPPLPDNATAAISGRLLRVSGADARRFLQGQATCDVEKLPPGRATFGAFCNPKGRVVANFLLAPAPGDAFLLRMADGIVEKAAKFLRLYIQFSKAEQEDVSGQYRLLGVLGAGGMAAARERFGGLPKNANDCLATEKAVLIRRGPESLECWAKADSLSATEADGAAGKNAALWEMAEIRAGVGMVGGETSEAFVPQVLNMEKIGGVSFDKGCYTGQEVVARMKFLGSLKKRMRRFSLGDGPLPARGDAVPVRGEKKSAGTVIAAAEWEGAREALAVVADAECENIGWEELPLPY